MGRWLLARRGQLRAALLERVDGRIAAWACLVCSLALTALAWLMAGRAVEARALERFDGEIDRTLAELTRQLEEHVGTLRAGAALFAASREVDRDEWHRFAGTLLLDARPAGLEALGYAPVLQHAERPSFIHAAQAGGAPVYRITPTGDRDEYRPVLFIEPPTTRNAWLLGFDLRSDDGFREAMVRARDTGDAVAASGFGHAIGGNPEHGAELFLFLPLFKQGEPAATVEQRRAAHVGFVFGVLRAGRLVDRALVESRAKIDLEVFEGEEAWPQRRLFRSAGLGEDAHASRAFGDRQAARQLRALGQVWTVSLRSRPALDAEIAGREHLLVGLVGLVIDGLLFAFVSSLVRQQREARRGTERMGALVEELRRREAELNLAQRVARLGSWTFEVSSGTLRWSDETYELFGVARGAAVSVERLLELVAEEDRPRVAAAWEGAQRGAPYQVEHRVRHPDGKLRWLEQRAEVRFDASGAASFILGTTHDVTERREAEQALRLSASVFQHAREAIVITDAQTRILEVNETFVEMSGYSRGELIGQSPKLLRSGRHDRAFYAEMWERLEERGYWRGEVWNKRRGGELYATALNISALIDPFTRKVSHYIGISSDITELKRSQQELERLAYHDALTRLPNRALLMDRLGMAVAQALRAQRLLVVAYLDLDGFKPVNDRLGHEAGDEVLVEMARRLERSVRAADTVARVGGDEFALILSAVRSRDDAEGSARRVLELLSRPVAVRGEEFVLSASIGLSSCPLDGSEPEALLRCADAAMYLAKRSGGRGWQWYGREAKGDGGAHI